MSAKTRWTRVAFGDVVRQVKDRVDPEESGLERYVAGEHMGTDDLRIRRWGTVGDGYLGPAFHMRFKPGQVLYGSRRTYLRKVAVADFEGITANTTFVLDSKDARALLPEFLPFVMQTEAFHEHAIKQSKGSVNPYINFTDLTWFEFSLPPLDEQRRLAGVLSHSEAHQEALRTLADSVESLLQATIDHSLLGELESHSSETPRVSTALGALPSHWRVESLGTVCTKIVDGVHKRPSYVSSGIPFLTVENLTRGTGIDFNDVRYVSEEDHHEFSRRASPQVGDVLVSKDGTLGVARVVEVEREFSIFVSLALLKPRREVLNPLFLRYYFDSSLFKRRLLAKVSGSALKHIHLVDFRASLIPIPPIEEQDAIVQAIRQVDSAHVRSLAQLDFAKALGRECTARLLSGGEA